MVVKNDGKVRPCVDYRQVNAVTRKNALHLPRIHVCRDAASRAKLFSTLDLTSSYHQIPVREIPKSVVCPKYGLYEYLTMPFGLCNAPATFERVMELALAGLQWSTCLTYDVDDVIVFGSIFMEHLF